MENIFLLLVVGALMALSFLLGARTSQKAHKGEEITLPSVNPLDKVKELKNDFQEIKELDKYNKEQEKYNTEMFNIDNYHGDSTGQKDL